jgi:hypothetical protein
MTAAQKMLLETLAGHFAWLKDAHPQKARQPGVKRADRCVQLRLRAEISSKKRAA